MDNKWQLKFAEGYSYDFNNVCQGQRDCSPLFSKYTKFINFNISLINFFVI